MNLINKNTESTDLVITEKHLKRRELMAKVDKDLRGQIKSNTGVVTSHHFAGGICSREMFVPAGITITGKIHRHEYLNIMIKGKAWVMTEDGFRFMEAPCTFAGRSGSRSVAYVVEDMIWTNVFRADTNDINELEEQEIVESYDKLEEEWETGITARPKNKDDFLPFKDKDGSWVVNENLKITVECDDINNISTDVQQLLLENR